MPTVSIQKPLNIDLLEFPEKQKLNWPTTLVLLLLHLGAIAALFMFSWANLAVLLFLLWFATGLGISMGYHRLHTHRSYQVPLALEYLFAVCGALTFEGGPIFWVATHRIHHQKSDMPGDPHSPHDGGWWAHVGWILMGEAKHNNTRLMSKYAPDLAKHPFYVWLNNYHWLPNVLLAGLLFAIGGLPMMLWGTCLRTVIGLHATWLVNSATHMWGTQRFLTTDTSRNNFWIALLTFGEGWHNNHHADPRAARHGHKWWEFDVTYLSVRLLGALGLAREIVEPSAHLNAQRES